MTDDQIRNFVVDLLVKRGRVEYNTALQLMDSRGVQLLRQAFTHWSINTEPNYELLEFLGDTTYNKVIAMYIYRRFPELANDPDGNCKLTESCKLYKSKSQAPAFSDKLGLPSMARYRALFYRPQAITHPDKVLQIKMDNKFKTDLFEAFLGAIEELIDTRIYAHSGYAIAYNIIESLLDEIHITINLQSTISNKAKAKEVVDRMQGTITYTKPESYRSEDGVEMKIFFNDSVKLQDGSRCRTMTFVSSNVRGYDAACDNASAQALKWLQQKCNMRW